MAATAAPFPIEETTIATLHAAYVSGRATAVSVCQAHLDRIVAYDRKGPALGAIIINSPDALADAAALDAVLGSSGKLVGPLHGIPVLVKDNYDVAGLQTTGGSAALLGWAPETDATVIARIGPRAESSWPKRRCPNGHAAAWITSIPCSPGLREIPTTLLTLPEGLQVAQGRGLPRASES